MIFGTVWTLSFIVTFPIIYFAKAVENGETYTCITGWTFLSRDQCKDILSHPSALSLPENNTLCPENDLKDEFNRTLSHCEKPKYLMEKIYYATFTVVGFIVPIIVILTSYYFIMQKVHKSRLQIKKIGNKNDGSDSRKNFNRTIMIFFGKFSSECSQAESSIMNKFY